jgi:integrase
LYRVMVDDLEDSNPAAPRLKMPSSRKGKNRKKNRKVERRLLPISPRLAKALRQLAKGRALDAPLFDRIPKLSGRFQPVVKRLKLEERTTPYALRHSSIVRQLLQGVPIRVVASHHDTSVAEIERTYSRYITGDPSEALTRATLLDFGALPGEATNVISMTR